MKYTRNIVLIFFLISCFNPNHINGQDIKKNDEMANIIFIEAAGNGTFASLNYERFICSDLSFRAGFGTLFVLGTSIPLLANYYIGDEKKLELGLGIVYINSFEKNKVFGEPNSIIITSTIGHSYQPYKGGITIRFSFTPFYVPITKRFVPYAGISIGYKF